MTLATKFNVDKMVANFGMWNFFVLPMPVDILARNLVNKFRYTFWRAMEMACGVGNSIHSDLDRMPVVARNEPGGTSAFNMI